MRKQHSMKRVAKLMAVIMTSAIVFGSISCDVNAESTGTVTVDSAKVRTDASTKSDVVAAAASGTTVTVTEETTDSSGNVWYHVTLSDGKTGYIRSDLMKVDEAPAADTAEQSDANSDASADADATLISAGSGNIVNGIDVDAILLPDGVNAQDFQQATVSVSTGKVRSDASTNDSIVAQISQGTNLVIAGSKNGNDSKTWYYVAFVDGGSQKYGYIRSDLINMGEVIVLSTPEPVEEAAPVEEQVEEPVINNDYELVFTDDGTGTNVWYLYNHIDNTREKLQELLDFADAQANKQAANQATIKTQKIIIIALGALLAIAVIVIIILAVKSRSYDYEEYEDDDDEDEDDEEEEEDEEDEEDYRRSRRIRNARAKSSRGRRRYEDDDDEDDEDDDEDEEPAPRKRRPANGGAAPRKPVSYSEDPRVGGSDKKKPKNFMLDDDDFEFEFLNMDDK